MVLIGGIAGKILSNFGKALKGETIPKTGTIGSGSYFSPGAFGNIPPSVRGQTSLSGREARQYREIQAVRQRDIAKQQRQREQEEAMKQETIRTENLPAKTRPGVRSVDIGTDEQERASGFNFTGRQAREGGQVTIKKGKGGKLEITPVKTTDPGEGVKESILGESQEKQEYKGVDKFIYYPYFEKGAELFGKVSNKFGDITGLNTAEKRFEERVLGGYDLKVSKGTIADIGKWVFFSPALATESEILRSVAPSPTERVLVGGSQKEVGGLTFTRAEFLTTEGKTGIGGGISRNKIVDFGGEDFVVTETFGFGAETKRFLEIPTGRIVTKPSKSFYGVEGSLGKSVNNQFLDFSVGRVRNFKRGNFRGVDDIFNFKGADFGISGDDAILLGGGSKSNKGESLFTGVLRNVKPGVTSFEVKGGGSGLSANTIFDQKALEQTSKIVSQGLLKSPKPATGTSKVVLGTSGGATDLLVQQNPVKLNALIPSRQQFSQQTFKVKTKDIVAPVPKINFRTGGISRSRGATAQIPKYALGQFPKITQTIIPREKLGDITGLKMKMPTPLKSSQITGKGFTGFRTFDKPFKFPVIFPFPPLGFDERKNRKISTRKYKETPSFYGAYSKFLGLPSPPKRTKRQMRYGVPLEVPFKGKIKLGNLIGKVKPLRKPKFKMRFKF